MRTPLPGYRVYHRSTSVKVEAQYDQCRVTSWLQWVVLHVRSYAAAGVLSTWGIVMVANPVMWTFRQFQRATKTMGSVRRLNINFNSIVTQGQQQANTTYLRYTMNNTIRINPTTRIRPITIPAMDPKTKEKRAP